MDISQIVGRLINDDFELTELFTGHVVLGKFCSNERLGYLGSEGEVKENKS